MGALITARIWINWEKKWGLLAAIDLETKRMLVAPQQKKKDTEAKTKVDGRGSTSHTDWWFFIVDKKLPSSSRWNRWRRIKIEGHWPFSWAYKKIRLDCLSAVCVCSRAHFSARLICQVYNYCARWTSHRGHHHSSVSGLPHPFATIHWNSSKWWLKLFLI